MKEETKNTELRIEKSPSPCPNAEAPLSKSERQKLESMTKRIMEQTKEAERRDAERREKLRVDYTNLKFSLVKLVIDTHTYTDKSAEDLIKEVDKLAKYIHE